MALWARILTGLVLSAGCATAALADWVEKKVDTLGFAAAFPREPKQESKVDQGVKLDIASAAAPGILCLVVVGDYGYTVKPDVELPASRDSFAKGLDASVTTQKRITFPRGSKLLQALEFDAANTTFNFRSILVVEGTRAYQIAGGIPKDGGNNTDLEHCVRGFKLIAK